MKGGGRAPVVAASRRREDECSCASGEEGCLRRLSCGTRMSVVRAR